MAVFVSTTKIDGIPLTDLIGTSKLTDQEWADLRYVLPRVEPILSGCAALLLPESIVQLGRMIRATMGGKAFRWPSGCYVNIPGFEHIMMGMETTLDKNGVSFDEVKGLMPRWPT